MGFDHPAIEASDSDCLRGVPKASARSPLVVFDVVHLARQGDMDERAKWALNVTRKTHAQRL